MIIVNAEILKDIDEKIYHVCVNLLVAKKTGKPVDLDDCLSKLNIVLFHFGHEDLLVDLVKKPLRDFTVIHNPPVVEHSITGIIEFDNYKTPLELTKQVNQIFEAQYFNDKDKEGNK